MKTVLIIQNELPHYREFLWAELRKAVNLYLADVGNNQLITPDGKVVSFDTYKFGCALDCMIISAGIREMFTTLRYILKFRPLEILGWTQFVGMNKSLPSRLIKCLYLTIFFDKVLLYYEHEKRLIPFRIPGIKLFSLNNTIADWEYKTEIVVDPKAFLFVGRYTEKSNLLILLGIFLERKELELNVIGVDPFDVPSRFITKNIRIHGKITDLQHIANIASHCAYFIYPGDVGLSIVHAIKLGLIPVVHSSLDRHMPEARAVAEKYPVIYFRRNDPQSLKATVELLSEMQPSLNLKSKIFSMGKSDFSQKVMVDNFIKAIESS